MADIASFVAKCNAWAAEVLAIPVVVPPPVGVRVRVTASCKVRAHPLQSDGHVQGSPEAVGSMGTVKPSASVVGGNPQNGYTYIDFDDGVSGWAWPANFVVI